MTATHTPHGFAQIADVEQVVESSEGCTIATLVSRGFPRLVIEDLEMAFRWLVVETNFFGARCFVYLTQGKDYHTGKAERSGGLRAFFMGMDGNGNGIWLDQYHTDYNEVIRRMSDIMGNDEMVITAQQHRELATEIEDRLWRDWFVNHQITLAATLRKLVG